MFILWLQWTTHPLVGSSMSWKEEVAYDWLDAVMMNTIGLLCALGYTAWCLWSYVCCLKRLGRHNIKVISFLLKLHITLSWVCRWYCACAYSLLTVWVARLSSMQTQIQSVLSSLLLTRPSLHWCGLKGHRLIGNPPSLSLSAPLWRLNFQFNDGQFSLPSSFASAHCGTESDAHI